MMWPCPILNSLAFDIITIETQQSASTHESLRSLHLITEATINRNQTKAEAPNIYRDRRAYYVFYSLANFMAWCTCSDPAHRKPFRPLNCVSFFSQLARTPHYSLPKRAGGPLFHYRLWYEIMGGGAYVYAVIFRDSRKPCLVGESMES